MKYFLEIDPFLLFANRYYLRKMSLDGNVYTLVRQGLSRALAIDYDYKESMVYYIDMGARRIRRHSFNFTGSEETLIRHNFGYASGISVDWVARLEQYILFDLFIY